MDNEQWGVQKMIYRSCSLLVWADSEGLGRATTELVPSNIVNLGCQQADSAQIR